MITLEDLENTLSERDQQQQDAMNELSSLFEDAGFVKESKANTISFEASIENVKALFSVDNTKYTYKAYITSEGDNSVTYSSKGDLEGMVDAGIKFLEHWAEFADGKVTSEEDITVEDEVEDSDELDEV